MSKILRLLGLFLLLPGLVALCASMQVGPASWYEGTNVFWGTPICLFVSWISLAHAGTLLSAVFLALGVRLDRRTALLAELSTLCSLCLAVMLPLVQLGVAEKVPSALTFMESSDGITHLGSPLFWDFCCIVVYGVLSFLFFHNHISSRNNPAQVIIRKPFAWLLLPLVLWVQSVVSLDFASTFFPEWQGAFFPIYFVVAAVYCGLALVNSLLCAEGYRVRLLEKMTAAGSWFVCVFWIWEFLAKGIFFSGVFVFAGVLPQLLWVSAVRNSRIGRFLVSLSILLGFFLERLYLISPEKGCLPFFGVVDVGLVSFTIGFFLLFYFGMRRSIGCFLDEEGTFFGDVDGSEMEADISATEKFDKENETVYVHPFTSEEFRTIRLPLLLGILAMLLFVLWEMNLSQSKPTLIEILPLTFPIVALVAGIALWIRSGVFREIPRRVLFVIMAFCILMNAISAIFFTVFSKDESEKVNGAGVSAVSMESRNIEIHEMLPERNNLVDVESEQSVGEEK